MSFSLPHDILWWKLTFPSCNINSIVLKGWQFFSPTETGNASAARAGCAKAPSTAPTAAATPSTPSAPTTPSTPATPAPAQPELWSVRRATSQPRGRPDALQPLRQLRGDPAPSQVANFFVHFWSRESHQSSTVYIFWHVTRVHYRKFCNNRDSSPPISITLIFCILWLIQTATHEAVWFPPHCFVFLYIKAHSILTVWCRLFSCLSPCRPKASGLSNFPSSKSFRWGSRCSCRGWKLRPKTRGRLPTTLSERFFCRFPLTPGSGLPFCTFLF